MRNKGISLRFASKKGISEEVPGVYKDINEVVDVVDRAGLSRKVAQLKPIAVIKGE